MDERFSRYYTNPRPLSSNRLSSALRRGKTLNRPERYQPAAPLLTNVKDVKSNDCDVWVVFSKVVTFWAPASLLSSFGGLPDKQSQQAWREKIALCFIAALMGGMVAFLTMGFTKAICPPSAANNSANFKPFGNAPGHLGINGWQFDITNSLSPPEVDFIELAKNKSGQDLTLFFKRVQPASCSSKNLVDLKFTAVNFDVCENDACLIDKFISEPTFREFNLRNTSTKVGYDWDQLAELEHYLVIDGNVLNLDPYINQFPDPIDGDMLDTSIRKILNNSHPEGGKDGTSLLFGRPATKAVINCLLEKFFAGNIDKATPGCFISSIFLYVSLIVILGIVMIRFAMACIFSWFISPRLTSLLKMEKNMTASSISQISPVVPGGSYGRSGMTKVLSMDDVGNDLFTVLFITCYSEDEVGIRCTCESMAATDYPDDRKLLFLVCDGIITGSGNDRSTPDICVGLMELLPEYGGDPRPKSYFAIAAGSKQHNMAKVYAGYFPYKDRKVPMICVVKCGTQGEQGKPKPGNRGKRDSQLVLMNFFSRVV